MCEPNDRQHQLIERADRLSEKAMKSGRFAPSELVRRMQDEQSLASYAAAPPAVDELMAARSISPNDLAAAQAARDDAATC